jgi:hypothetical protein
MCINNNAVIINNNNVNINNERLWDLILPSEFPWAREISSFKLQKGSPALH